MNDTSKLMSRLGLQMKKGRQRFWDSEDFVIRLGERFGKPEASLFFRTQGCRHDRSGGCTMCDYSAGPLTTAKKMISYVSQGLDHLPVGMEGVLVSPSGSFLDTWEVPLEARIGILAVLAERQYPMVAFETRAETITMDSIATCRNILPEQKIKVYCGLESADPWVSQFAINKNLDQNCFARAMKTLTSNNVEGVANVLLGAPFLSEAELIEDAVKSINWALGVGAVGFCLFPCHVKRWTQIEWLHSNAGYHPPSLWSFVEVLRRLGERLVTLRGEIAWFTGYGAFNIIASPTTCLLCHESVITQLQGFADTNDYIFIENLISMNCSCKDHWQQKLEVPDPNNREQRALMAYDQIGSYLYANQWLTIRKRVLAPLLSDHLNLESAGISEQIKMIK